MEVLDTADVNLLLARNADYQVRAPSKVTPTLPIIDVDLDDLQSTAAGTWDTEHPIVGELAAIRGTCYPRNLRHSSLKDTESSRKQCRDQCGEATVPF